MKFLQLLLVFGLFCKAIDAEQIEQIEENVSFSVSAIWLRYHKKECTCPAPWAEGVQEYYVGVKDAVKDGFKSEKAIEIGNCAVKSLGEFIEKLIYFTGSNSTIVTTSVTSILNSLSTCRKLNESGLKIIIEFDKVLLPLIDNFNRVATSLSPQIGDLACSFTDDLSDLGREFSKFQKGFIRNCQLFQCKKKVDYECVLKKLQKLFNTVASINENVLNKCSCKASQAEHESVMILDLLYSFMAIAVTGINSCVLDELYAEECPVSKNFKSVSLTFEYTLVQVIQAVCAITYPFENTIQQLLTAFVNISQTLNEAVKAIFGLVQGVGLTVEKITTNLLQGLQLG
ncbi:uncharacterized protein LOC119076217 [Bradysia coprophila]|uniref:uncharacterized protein LOC119076217 n=1 Tax=Bradysia coprophila TaxID=38358 RepID=UPI00187DCDD7|nr:uncharacterized protein LOC119076217 [Bradysia coprophila]